MGTATSSSTPATADAERRKRFRRRAAGGADAAADARRDGRAGAHRGRGVGAAGGDRMRAAAQRDPLRAARERGRRRWRGSRRGWPTGPSRRSRRSTPGKAEIRAVIERARERRRASGPADDPLPRRDPPLQQGPAGRAAAGGRGGAADPDRGDHREPLLRGQLGAALAQPGLRAARRSSPSRWRSCCAARWPIPSAGIADPPPVEDDGAGDARRAQRRRRPGRRSRRWSGRSSAPAASRSTSPRSRTRCSARRSTTTARATATTTSSPPGSRPTRGSDVDASLYYLAVMLEGGEDPRFIARRMVILASEDIGNADPQALLVADAAARAVDRVGLPECALNLAQAASTWPWRRSRTPPTRRSAPPAPRSASNGAQTPPDYLRDAHYPGAEGARPRRAATATPTTSPAASPTSSCSPRASRSAASTSRPTRGFEAELAARLAGAAARASRSRSDPRNFRRTRCF